MNTFRELDSAAGRPPLPPPPPEGEFPLPAWYRSVIDVAIDDLTTEDLARACRQDVHLKEVVPRALEILKNDPLAGEFYDGELMVAMLGIQSEFWLANLMLLESLQTLIAAHEEEIRGELLDDVVRFQKKLIQ